MSRWRSQRIPGRVPDEARDVCRSPFRFCQSKELTLAKDDPKTSIDAGGLRYRSKVAGSPFSATGAFGAATMSCFLCGKHRPRAQLKSRKLLGKAQAVCSPSCKELDSTQS
jgi:hypothetical protein